MSFAKEEYRLVSGPKYVEGFVHFMSMASGGEVNGFTINGGFKEEDDLYFVTAVFPTRIPFLRHIYFSNQEREKRGSFFDSVLKLSVSNDELGGGNDNYYLRRRTTERMIRQGLPSTVLVLGGDESSPMDKAALYLVAGTSIATGLREIQKLIREEHLKWN